MYVSDTPCKCGGFFGLTISSMDTTLDPDTMAWCQSCGDKRFLATGELATLIDLAQSVHALAVHQAKKIQRLVG